MNSLPNALIPLLGLIGLLAWVLHKRRRQAGWSRASGVVIAMLTHRNRCQAPVVRFRSADDREFTHYSSTGSSPPGFTVGEDVAVLYDPANPKRAVIPTFFQLWFGECFTALVLVVSLVFTVLVDLGVMR